MTDISIADKWEFHEILGGDHEDYELVEGSDWTQDYKYQQQTAIVFHKPTGKYYEGTVSRSGSPFTDWEYDSDQTLYEVEKHEETRVVVTWKAVK